MSEVYVMDACALIALLSQEEGSDRVLSVYNRAVSGDAALIMNVLNLLEVYYGDYRAHGKEAASNMVANVYASPIQIIPAISGDIFEEAGRLKASYRISLAGSVALAQTLVSDGTLLTSDHHEFDVIEEQENIRLEWIR